MVLANCAGARPGAPGFNRTAFATTLGHVPDIEHGVNEAERWFERYLYTHAYETATSRISV
jgi:hypothetical protein